MENSLIKLLGERIRTIRKAQGLSQDELADASGVNQKYVSEIERAQVNASISIYDAIAKGLGLSLSELTEGLEYGSSSDEFLAVFRRAATLDDRERKILLEVIRGVFKGMDIPI